MKLSLYLSVALLLVSCGKHETKIAGQAFVVTQGKANIKLALVEVSVIPEKDIVDYLKAKHSNGLEQQKVLMPDLDLAEKAANSSSIASARANQEHDLAFTRLLKAADDDLTDEAGRADVATEKKRNLH